jgi:hypothetical protein
MMLVSYETFHLVDNYTTYVNTVQILGGIALEGADVDAVIVDPINGVI